jgi:hypothetical protein
MPAWTNYYEEGNVFEEDSREGMAVVGYKRELAYNGYGAGLLYTPSFGLTMTNQVKKFQQANGLTADGVIGPKTARALFKKRIGRLHSEFDVPDQLLAKKTQGESSWDIAAYNENKRADGSLISTDHGLNMINDVAQRLGQEGYPTVEDAYNPAFSLGWAVRKLAKDYEYSGNDWDGALATYNVGLYYAKKWVAAGKPASGLFTTGGKDYAEMCTRYVGYIRRQTLT